MKRRIWHVLPTLALVVLLALVARAQTGNRAVVVTRVIPAPAAIVKDVQTGLRSAARPELPRTLAQCSSAYTVTPNASWPVADGHVLQPILRIEPDDSWDLLVEPSAPTTTGTIAVTLYDPSTGAPVANSYPLAKRRFSTATAEIVFDAFPMVTRVSPTVSAYLPAIELALDPSPVGSFVRVDDGSSHASDDLPAARDLSTGTWAQMGPQGSHFVVGRDACTVTAAGYDDLWVGAQKLPVDQVYPVTEMMQSFETTTTLTATWVELALPQLSGTTSPIQVRIYEDHGVFPPDPATITAATIDVFGSGQTELPSFVRSAPFQVEARFRSGTKYWMHVIANSWSLGAGTDPGATGFYIRPGSSTPFFPIQGTSMAFRLIGRPDNVLPPPVFPSGFTSTGAHAATLTATSSMSLRLGDRVLQRLPSSNVPPIEMIQLALVGMPLDSSTPCTCTALESVALRMSSPNRSTDTADCPLRYAFDPGTPATPTPWLTMMMDRAVVTRSYPTATANEFPMIEMMSGRPGVSILTHHNVGGPTETALVQRKKTFSWEQVSGPMALVTASGPVTRTCDDCYSFDQVLRSREVTVATATAEIVQTFRVLAPMTVTWVELGIPGTADFVQPLQLRLLDSHGLPGPDASPISSTLTATTMTRDATPLGRSVFMASNAFPTVTALSPGRDYWLVARYPTAGMSVATHVTQTAELGGRKFFWRPGSSGAFNYDASRALSFRIIGTPTATTDVPIASLRHGLEFSVSPNPGSQSLMFRWQGGSGRVSLEICDVSGRRVRRVRDVGAGVEGSWRWNGTSDSGQKLPAGVYFARLQGPAGTVHRRVIRLD